MMTLVISLVLAVLAITGALHALLSKRDSKSALAWVAFCLLLPLLGPVTYLIFGINRTISKAQRTYLVKTEEDAADIILEPAGTQLRPLSLVGEKVTGHGLRSCDDIQVLENGEALYPAILAAIDAARESVYCATYIFQNDETGSTFVAAFSRAQERGVDVRIIIDGLGAIAYWPRVSRSLAKHKLNFKHFNPIRLFPPSLNINLRNHRKILVIDDHCAFTGGQNIGDRHLVDQVENTIPTRDLHFRLTGKIVDDLKHSFLRDWSHCCGVTGKTAYASANKNRDHSEIWSRLILDGPNENLDKLSELLVGILSTAKTRIWIMTPYFLPESDLVGALLGARLRGIDVRILLPERANIYMAHWAAQHGVQHILAKGLKVFSQPAPFIHTKALLIDDNYAMIGSANLDPRSLRLNFELGIEVFSEKFNRKLSDYFQKQLDQSSPLDREKLATRPIWMRIRNATAWLFSPYL